jgi:hypothetical protein
MTRFWNNLHHVTLKVESLESQIMLKVLGRKPKGQDRIAKIGYGHLWLREENLSFNNNTSFNIICFEKQ